MTINGKQILILKKKKDMEKLNLYQKLHKIQEEILGLKKDKKSNNYEYVTGNKLLGFIKPLMNEYKLILKQEVVSIDNERVDYKTGVGTSYEKPKSEILTKVMMKFTWIDVESGEKDENSFGANGMNEWEKGLGSALTYAERYFILKYFHIATDEDDIDNPDRKPQEQTNQQSTHITTIPTTPTDNLPKELEIIIEDIGKIPLVEADIIAYAGKLSAEVKNNVKIKDLLNKRVLEARKSKENGK